jgi:hypothetical protein
MRLCVCTFQFGDFRTANEAIGLSKAALSRIDVVRGPLFVARIRLVEYNLSSVQDDPATAYNTISRLASEVTRIPFAGPDEADFKCSVHLAHCHASVLAGNLHQTRDAIPRTEHWQYAMALLRETPFPSTPYYDLHTALYDAQILLRKGRPLEATRAFLDCKREAYSLGEFRTLAILLPDLAMAQLQCGMLADAQENIREARPIVQADGTDSMVRLSQQSTESVLR